MAVLPEGQIGDHDLSRIPPGEMANNGVEWLRLCRAAEGCQLGAHRWAVPVAAGGPS
jgi:hypothetical protein